MSQRKIIHIDMDSFFASVEMRDDPRLIHQPVAVGGKADSRGIICTANYIARKYGVHSAMPTYQAQRLCPSLKIISPNIKKYKEISKSIRHIFAKYSDIIEPVSIDEAYIDVTKPKVPLDNATQIANNIRAEIFESERLTSSAGVSVNKFLAKIASEINKPNGIAVIKPHQVADFVKTLPIKSICGVGPVTKEKMYYLNLFTCSDLQQYKSEDLYNMFGKFGMKLYEYCRGIDTREVKTQRTHKSISVEHTYPNDLNSIEQCTTEVPKLIERLHTRVNNEDMLKKVRKIFVKVKFSDFRQTTIEQSCLSIDQDIIYQLLNSAYSRNSKGARLLGIGVRFENASRQLAFDFSDL